MLENDVVAIGSGWAGPWPNEDYGAAHDLRRFAEYANRGDLVIAKHGKRRALGIGVLGDYQFDEDQDDIEGWDLCHLRRVRWLPKTEHRFKRLALSQGRFTGCNDRGVLAWVERTVAKADLRPPNPTKLPQLPTLGPRLELRDLSPNLRKVVRRAQTWSRAWWGGGFGALRPSESELIAHITVPLLVALGWAPQQIAIGWKYADVALFRETLRTPNNCAAIVESKRLGDGLLWAEEQAAGYAAKVGHSIPTVVSDGIRYRLAFPDSDTTLYANLQVPRRSALDLFAALRWKRWSGK
jgi:hypothetical protein